MPAKKTRMSRRRATPKSSVQSASRKTTRSAQTRAKKKVVVTVATPPEFVCGLDLNRDFYYEVVEPLMREHFPDLLYSAGLVGHGSDVLGFDSPTSVDHDWGPHLQMFFTDLDFVNCREQVDAMLRAKLPTTFKGFPTHFEEGDYYLKHKPTFKKRGPVNHLFRFQTLRTFFQHYLGFDVTKRPSFQDWLLFPQQALIEVTSGQLYRDDLEVQQVRDRFAWYPDEIWKYMLRVQWGKISDELQYPARSGEEGDAVGSMVITMRSIQKIMFLCFLMERRYAPYSKWFGTAFQKWLKSSGTIYPLLNEIIREKDWRKRQKLLMEVYQKLGQMHNALHITPVVDTEIADFHGRGYPAVKVEGFIQALEGVIRNPKLKDMRFPLGNVDQFIDHARINHMNYVYTQLSDIIQ